MRLIFNLIKCLIKLLSTSSKRGIASLSSCLSVRLVLNDGLSFF